MTKKNNISWDYESDWSSAKFSSHQILNHKNFVRPEALFSLAEGLFKFPWTTKVTKQTYDVQLENLYSLTVRQLCYPVAAFLGAAASTV